MSDVVVIGAGVIGASLALRLAERGAAVTLLDASRAASGSSGASFAWLNAARKQPRGYFDLNVAGMRAHAELADELGSVPWHHAGGRLTWFDPADREAARRSVARLQSWGYRVDWLEPREAAELEPSIDQRRLDGAEVAWFPDEAWIDPVLYVASMLAAATRHGAAFRPGVRAEGLEIRSGRAAGVRTRDGALPAGIVVDCTGASVNRWANALRWDIPMASTTGLLAFTPPVPASISHIVGTPNCAFRPDGAGRLMVHADWADEAVARGDGGGSVSSVAERLVQAVVAVVPAIGRADVEAVRVTERPIPADGYPVVGWSPGLDNHYLLVTHSGVTLAPVLARLAAAEILDGTADTALEPYRPSRFVREA